MDMSDRPPKLMVGTSKMRKRCGTCVMAGVEKNELICRAYPKTKIRTWYSCGNWTRSGIQTEADERKERELFDGC